MASKPGAPRPAELTFGSPQHAKIVDYTAKLVVRGGVEPPTFRFSGGRSYQLSYLTLPGTGPGPSPSAADPSGPDGI